MFKKAFIITIIATYLFSCSTNNSDKRGALKEKYLSKIDSLETEIKKAIDEQKLNPDVKLSMFTIQQYEFYAIDFPEDEKTPDYLFKAAQLYENILKDFEKSIVIYKKIYDNYPDFNKHEMALFHIGNIYHELGNTTESVESFELFIKNHPNHEFADDAKAMINIVQMTEEELLEFLNKQNNETL